MSLARLRRISYLFPDTSAADRRFFADLALLLGEVPGCRVGASGVTLPVTPGAALPGTAIIATAVSRPMVLLAADLPLDVDCGGLRLYSTATDSAAGAHSVTAGAPPPVPALPPAEVYARLQGHIMRLDHTGLNIPVNYLTRAAWDGLLTGLASVAAIYRCPTGEDWPFILPTTHDEYSAEIRDFNAVREPKWELVYDGWASDPVIQIDLETDLTRTELEALFPAPYGQAFPDLAAYFRSVYLAHPWPHLLIRCDLRYRSGGPSDWETGAWLVTAGGRITP